jgi:nicotinamide-nucleotide amidase
MLALFQRLGRTMPEVNVRQAMVPEGATLLENSRGTAPGLWLEADGHIVVLLPGPPHEMKAMFAEQLRPRLAPLAAGFRLLQREWRTTGLSESQVEQRIGSIYAGYPSVQTSILAAAGEIHVQARLWSDDAAGADKVLGELAGRIAMALGEAIFTNSGQTLEEVVAAELTSHQATIAVAESCTGGLLAERLTSIPGSSAYFRGGVVCYSNDLKTAWADVPASLIKGKGAVSPEVARAMAEGIRRRTNSTFGVGITGIAGPGGGSPEKPVGLVHIALATAGNTTECGRRIMGDRERIRWQASELALDAIRLHFLYARQSGPAAGQD